jgi:hypothetical protein
MLPSASTESAAQTEWMERARRLPVKDRLLLIESTVQALPKIPTARNVFWRKALLRLRDASRLEAGLVSPAELHRENSPFTAMDFRKARISFRPRVRA